MDRYVWLWTFELLSNKRFDITRFVDLPHQEKKGLASMVSMR